MIHCDLIILCFNLLQAAYRDNTLGLPKLCPASNINKIDQRVLFTFLSQHYTPKRMVVAGVGVEHQRLVDAVQKYFVDEKSIWESEPDLCIANKNLMVDQSIAQYTGGLIQVSEDCYYKNKHKIVLITC